MAGFRESVGELARKFQEQGLKAALELHDGPYRDYRNDSSANLP